MAKSNRLTHSHIEYIIIRRHIEKALVNQIYKELTTEAIIGQETNEYGQIPLETLSAPYFYKKVKKIAQDRIVEVKEMWLTDLLTIPLANKKVRIKELSRLYDSSNNSQIKAKILKDIRDEVSEGDVITALKGQHSTVNVAAGLSVDMIKSIANTIIDDKLDQDGDDDDEI